MARLLVVCVPTWYLVIPERGMNLGVRASFFMRKFQVDLKIQNNSTTKTWKNGTIQNIRKTTQKRK